MQTKSVKTVRKPRGPDQTSPSNYKRSLRDVAREPSTLAGVLTIASQLLLAGPGALTNPGVWAGVLSGVGLVLTREGR